MYWLVPHQKLNKWLLTFGNDGVSKIILGDYSSKTHKIGIQRKKPVPEVTGEWAEKCQVLVRETHSKNVKRNVWSFHVCSF